MRTACEESAVATEPLIAVIIPVYKQSQFLADAVLSAVHQSLRACTKVIILNDGCPFESTDQIACELRDAFPGEVYYLHTHNGGLGSARNEAIRFVLAAWPSVRAIFPLDADNRLSPATLEGLWAALAAAPADAGWAYQDLSFFGTETGIFHLPAQFSRYRLLHENYCDAGSLIRRELFESDIWFYDGRKLGIPQGNEDWEFFLSATLRGCWGIHVADTLFLYRRHGYSMTHAAARDSAKIAAFVNRRHRDALGHNGLTLLEHRELPRFALVFPDADLVHFVTSCSIAPTRILTVDEFLDEIAELERAPLADAPYIPPITVCFAPGMIEILDVLRLTMGVLFSAQWLLQDRPAVSLSVSGDTDAHHIEIIEDLGTVTEDAAMVALPLRDLRALVHTARDDQRPVTDALVAAGTHLRMRIGHAFSDAAGQPIAPPRRSLMGIIETLAAAIARRSAMSDRQGTQTTARGVESHADFMYGRHVKRRETTFPYCVESSSLRNLFFVAPTMRLGGVDQMVLNLGRELANVSAYHVHLVVTDADYLQTSPESLMPFRTVTILTGIDAAAKQAMLRTVLTSADIIVNAHSLPGYVVLPELKATRSMTYVSLLQVIDTDDRGAPVDFPLVATREYEGLIDYFMIPSQRIRRFCSIAGVPPEKLLLIPNAPSVAPPSLDAGIQHARRAGARRYGDDRPIRILYAARFDRQKGVDRLERVIGRLAARGVPFRCTMVGEAVSSARDEASTLPHTRVVPPVFDSAALARHYQEADVLLLLSRGEGLPLAVLEAMAFGVIVITTDGSGTREYVQHGREGFLLDATQSEEELATEACDLIDDIAAYPEKYAAVRVNACFRAMKHSWGTSARLLLDCLQRDCPRP